MYHCVWDTYLDYSSARGNEFVDMADGASDPDFMKETFGNLVVSEGGKTKTSEAC